MRCSSFRFTHKHQHNECTKGPIDTCSDDSIGRRDDFILTDDDGHPHECLPHGWQCSAHRIKPDLCHTLPKQACLFAEVRNLKTQLSQWQFMLLNFWLLMGAGVIFLPYLMAQFVTRDAWIGALLLIVPFPLLAWIFARFVRLFPGQTLVESLISACGPWFGRVLVIWFLVWLYIATCMFLRKTTMFLEETVMPDTPLYVLSLLVTLPLAYAVFMGIEVLGRLSELLTPLGMLVSIGLSIMSLRHAHWHNLAPVLADGWTPVLRSAVSPWRFATQILLALQFVTALRQPVKTVAKNIVWVGIALTFLGFAAELLIVMILGNQITFNKYPIMEVVRVIQYGEFFQRLDPLYVMGVLMALVLQLSILHYAMSVGMNHLLNLDDYRTVVWGGAATVWAGSIFFWRDGASLDHFILYTTPGFFLASIGTLPLVAISVQWLRQKIHPTPEKPA